MLTDKELDILLLQGAELLRSALHDKNYKNIDYKAKLSRAISLGYLYFGKQNEVTAKAAKCYQYGVAQPKFTQFGSTPSTECAVDFTVLEHESSQGNICGDFEIYAQ